MSKHILSRDLPKLKSRLIDLETQIGQEYDYVVLKAMLHEYARTWVDVQILEGLKGVGDDGD